MTKAQINKIAKNKKITHCYIYKNGSFYATEGRGYTDFKYKAGVFTKKEAIESADKCDELTLIPIDIENHNQMIIDTVKDLMSRYINKSMSINKRRLI